MILSQEDKRAVVLRAARRKAGIYIPDAEAKKWDNTTQLCRQPPSFHGKFHILIGGKASENISTPPDKSITT
jgi:hypothetical protein